MTHTVIHEPERNRYVLRADGEQVGIAEYEIRGDRIVFTHTEVDPARRERGLAGELVRAALDDVRTASEQRVVAQCPYVAYWFREHPDYGDLLTR